MPQKYNRAGKLQNYVPAGNGDESGEYRGGESGSSTRNDIQNKYLRANKLTDYKKEFKSNLNITDEEMERRKEKDIEGHDFVKGVDGSSAYFDHELIDKETGKRGQKEAQDLYDKLRERASTITNDLRSMGLELMGAEYNSKTGTSLMRKINKTRREKTKLQNADDLTVMKTLGDITRFTHQGNHNDLAKVTEKLIDKLNSHPDYEIMEVDNKYIGENQTYKAIHLKVRDKKTDMNFEIQIHSPETLKTKSITHPWYDIIRDDKQPQEKRDALEQKSISMWKEIPDPEGIQNIKSYVKGE